MKNEVLCEMAAFNCTDVDINVLDCGALTIPYLNCFPILRLNAHIPSRINIFRLYQTAWREFVLYIVSPEFGIFPQQAGGFDRKLH